MKRTEHKNYFQMAESSASEKKGHTIVAGCLADKLGRELFAFIFSF